MQEHEALFSEIYERALAERAIACKKWCWGAGMLISIPPQKGSEKRSFRRIVEGDQIVANSGCYPVFNDAATRGCLLGIVRQAYGKEATLILSDVVSEPGKPTMWCVTAGNNSKSKKYYPSEVEALVAALEEAP